jgi:hypothetical protein
LSVGILGSGFGLYGYLPSLVLGFNERVILPTLYQAKLSQRHDVAAFAGNVDWVQDDAEVLQRADTLIISRRPREQAAWVLQSLRTSRIRRYILEKPLAPSPAEASAILDELEKTASRVRIGYIFRFEPWARPLAKWLSGVDKSAALSIRWQFRAHHYATDMETWKRQPAEGGGAVKFYGTHLIGLLAEHGYTDVTESSVSGPYPGEQARWTAVLSGSGRPSCQLSLDSTSETPCFEIRGNDPRDLGLKISISDPFEYSQRTDVFDRRVGALMKLYGSLLYDTDLMPTWYRASVNLWQAVERSTLDLKYVGAPRRASNDTPDGFDRRDKGFAN